MKRWYGLFLLGAAGYLLYLLRKNKMLTTSQPVKSAGAVTLVTPLPMGVTMTGRIERTTNTQPPGAAEVSAFGIKDWAEIVWPSGERGWAEVKIGG